MIVQPQQLHAVFRHNLRERRRELRLSQIDLAQRAGLEQAHISQLERGKLNPNLGTLAKIAEALDTTPSALLSTIRIGGEKNSVIST